MFLVQLAYDTINNEIEDLDTKATKKDIALTESLV